MGRPADTAVNELPSVRGLVEEATVSPASGPVRAHMPALDGLRGLAILLVMGFHFGQDPDGVNSLGPVLSKVLGIGYHGVDLFFVLSGFLITGILLDTKGEA